MKNQFWNKNFTNITHFLCKIFPSTCPFDEPDNSCLEFNFSRIPLHEKLSFEEVLETLPPEWNICFVESTSKNSHAKHKRSIPYHEADFTEPTVMVFGKEAGGLSQATREKAVKHGTHKILNTYIPTIPELDSLNVAMAATVLIYEMVGVVLLL